MDARIKCQVCQGDGGYWFTVLASDEWAECPHCYGKGSYVPCSRCEDDAAAEELFGLCEGCAQLAELESWDANERMEGVGR